MKKCPNCEGTDLIVQKISANVEVDACPKCGGVWFEKGEVGDFTNFAKDIPDLARLAKEARASGKKCPECSTGMKEMKYTGSSELMIDYCESCHGVWFDGGEVGELKNIADKLDDVKLRISREVWKVRFGLHQRSALTCPKCKEKTLHTFNTSEGVTVDLCDKCRGMWMDKGETARAAELETDFPDYRAVAPTAVLTNFICPCCGNKMVTMKYSPKSDLMIEYCQKCGGMFLDAGEMSKVETISANAESAGKKLVRCLKQMHDEGYVKLM